MRILTRFLFSIFWIGIALSWAIGGMFYYNSTYPVSETPKKQIVFKIKKGMTLKDVAQELSRQNLIRGASSFRAISYLQEKQSQIKAGEYALSPSMTPLEILTTITSGQSILYPVTIPEGYRITEIAVLIEQHGLVNRGKFVRLTKDDSLIKSLKIHADSLEGYLYPETYNFDKNIGEAGIIKAMTETFFRRAFKPEYAEQAKQLGFTFHQIVILASMIEKETGLGVERKLISSVFHNRLRKNMLLQCDPTVIYAMENFDGNIRKKDLAIDSLYNTYKHKGLPPGPIANPGLDSIVAALYPAESDNLYFVSRQDGSHEFSSNLDDHNNAVRKYQLRQTRG